jgi:uncharacterized protein (UPF0333 family)
MDKTKVVISFLVVLLIVSIATSFMFYQKAQTSTNSKPSEVSTQPANNIKYATFSSPKLDFTFEYPSTWTYKDMSNTSDSGTVIFTLYNTSDTTGAPVLTVYSPMGDNSIDFCSGKRIGRNSIFPYMQLNISPTNDSQTFVTYEQCGQESSMSGAVVYWQKSEKFLSTDDIKDLSKINAILFSLDDNSQESKAIGLHIAQSIKIR